MAKRAAGSGMRQQGEDASWELQLYIAGDNINGRIALTQLKKICLVHLNKNCHIQVIDLKKKPEMALKEHIVALPMLVRTSPGPKKVLIGDLTNEEKVISTLEINRYGKS